jgi:hypothetical protein
MLLHSYFLLNLRCKESIPIIDMSPDLLSPYRFDME